MKQGTHFEIEASDLIFISREGSKIILKIEEIAIEMPLSMASVISEILKQAQYPEALSSY